jgi:glycosyltransferase involved in cell wall biosynthesis
MLPEIVDHEVNGLVIDDEPESLAQAIIKLSQDINFRERLGYNALKKAHTEFSLQKQFRRIVEFYEEIMQKKKLFA